MQDFYHQQYHFWVPDSPELSKTARAITRKKGQSGLTSGQCLPADTNRVGSYQTLFYGTKLHGCRFLGQKQGTQKKEHGMSLHVCFKPYRVIGLWQKGDEETEGLLGLKGPKHSCGYGNSKKRPPNVMQILNTTTCPGVRDVDRLVFPNSFNISAVYLNPSVLRASRPQNGDAAQSKNNDGPPPMTDLPILLICCRVPQSFKQG